MPGVKNSNSARAKKRLVLVGLTMLTVLLGYLAYDEVQFLLSGWRWGRNGFVLFKIGCRALALILLTLGAAVVPVIYCLMKAGLLHPDANQKR